MRYCFAFILILFSSACESQLPQQIRFTNYNRENGLPEESAYNIIQDSRGFLWIGSKEGLIRFDGKNFRTWYADPADSSKFDSNSIVVTGEYKPGLLLFVSGGSLWEVNTHNLRFRQIKAFKGKMLTARPAKLANGEWSFADRDSLYIVNTSFEFRWKLSLKEFLLANTGLLMISLHHPYLLVESTGPGPFYLLNYDTREVTTLTIDNSKLDSRSQFFTSLVYDSITSRLYLSAFFNGNYYCDLDLTNKKNNQPVLIGAQRDGAVRKSMILPNGLMMQAGDNGLHITDFMKSVSFNTKTTGESSLASNTVLDICPAKDGSYWLATLNGISHFTLTQPIISYRNIGPVADKTDLLKFIHASVDGSLFFLNQTNGLSRLDQSTGKFTHLDSSVTYCWSAIKSGNEIIVTGSGKRVAVYDLISGRVTNPSFLQPFYTKNTDLVTLVFQSKNGDRWYSCNGAGGLIRNPANTNRYLQYSRNTSPPDFSHSYVHTAAEDSKGNIWWANNKTQMLLKWDASMEKFEEYPVNKLTPQFQLQNGINNLFVDVSDNLWIAMDGAGMLQYNLNSKSGKYFDINKGLPSDAVYGLCQDPKQRVWFGTRKGLCCYLNDKDKILTFTNSDGLPNEDFEGNGILYDKKENLLYVGAKQYIAWFNPDSLISRAIASRPPVYIDEMLVNGKPFYFGEKRISLLPGENNIDFSFASPDYNRNNQLIFQYQLQGASDDWIDLGDKRSISFNHLQHGNYVLSVRCKYRGTDAWTETELPMKFTILTPWPKTWWFRLAMAIVAVLLGWYIVRSYYRSKLEKQKGEAEKKRAVEQERTRIATDMHDDFGASLSRIKFISEKMQLTQADDEKLKTDLVKISAYSDEMAEKMNEIVWALNERYDSLEDLASFSRAYAADYLQQHHIHLYFKENIGSNKKIQGETRRNIFMVIKESLRNIVKHAHATEVKMEFTHLDHHLDVLIKDNGKGINLNNIRPFANGLENMRKRMHDIAGSVEFRNENGTEVRISTVI